MITEIHWTAQSAYPILTTLQLLPLVVLMAILAMRENRLVPLIGIGGAVVELLLAINLWLNYDSHQGAMQFAERVELFGPLAYHASVDGVSVLFILLTALITLLMVIYGQVRQLLPHAWFLALVFAVEAALMSMFTTVDLLWFVLVSVVELGLVGILLARWSTSLNQNLPKPATTSS